MHKTMNCLARAAACLLLAVFLFTILAAALPTASAETVKVYGDNLVYGSGAFDDILSGEEQERTLNIDWALTYPAATFGGAGGDSPAKIRNVNGNPVLVLEYSTGNFASFFADLWADGEKLPAGLYRLSMDLMGAGTGFTTDNVGFNLYNQYSDVRIYDNGWQNCNQREDGWLHYEAEFEISADSVDSIQLWFNTMGLSPEECALYIDNLCVQTVELREVEEEPTAPSTEPSTEPTTEPTAEPSTEMATEPSTETPTEAATEPEPTQIPDGLAWGNLVYGDGRFEGILGTEETERTLNADWLQSYPAATFGGSVNGDSPAVIRDIGGNSVLVLEYSTGNFASFFADLWADGERLPAGYYKLSMDIKPQGTGFITDNIGFNLYNQYSDVRIYDNGWQNCTLGGDGWYHYSRTFYFEEGTVDSIQMWFNTMGLSPEECALYIDNLSFSWDGVPRTGDEAQIGCWLVLGLTALSGTCIFVNLPRNEACKKIKK